MKLNNNHEIIGVLSEITQNKEHITLTFLIKHHITLPQNKTKKLNLQKLKGKQIGLGHFNNTYFIRTITSK